MTGPLLVCSHRNCHLIVANCTKAPAANAASKNSSVYHPDLAWCFIPPFPGKTPTPSCSVCSRSCSVHATGTLKIILEIKVMVSPPNCDLRGAGKGAVFAVSASSRMMHIEIINTEKKAFDAFEIFDIEKQFLFCKCVTVAFDLF